MSHKVEVRSEGAVFIFDNAQFKSEENGNLAIFQKVEGNTIRSAEFKEWQSVGFGELFVANLFKVS